MGIRGTLGIHTGYGGAVFCVLGVHRVWYSCLAVTLWVPFGTAGVVLFQFFAGDLEVRWVG